MNDHVEEQLSSLLAGELGGAETIGVLEHLRGCDQCESALISAAVAHGSLRAARRALAPASQSSFADSALVAPLAPLVMPSRFPRRLVGLVAAAVLALAVVGGVVATRSNPTSAPLAAVASLEHLDAPASAVGHVSVHATSAELVMIVTTTGLPVLQANHFYEVWLLAPTTNKMLPLGVLSVTGRSTFTISRPLMSQFSAIDISLQDNDGSPQHSKTSVLRGTVTAV
jgi:hypothetical protein